MKIKFSVITITKNNAGGFNKTKQSIDCQSFLNFEWVVIDGDKEPDNGIYDAMNKGIERSKGDYLIFMNAGDEFADEHVLQKLSGYDADFVYGDALEEGYIKRSKPVRHMKGGMITHHQAMLYKRSVIGDLRYDESYKLAADYKFTLQFLKQAESHIQVDFPICIFETGGISQTHAAKARQEEKVIRKELKIRSPLTYFRQSMAFYIRYHYPQLYRKLKT
jgi:putative colanic acid biosynthesis glycosyltransferase